MTKKSLDNETRPYQGRQLHARRLHHRRRQGRRYRLRHRRSRPGPGAPRPPLSARSLPGENAGDDPLGAGRHHADVGFDGRAAVGRRPVPGSPVTPAIRLNDTTDIWSARGGRYKEEPSRHHRTARIDQARKITDLGLYSITFSNEVDIDADECRGLFGLPRGGGRARHAALPGGVQSGVRHPPDRRCGDIGTFINDNIVRTLAGVMSADHPQFLKLQYNGARAMEELASYDPGHLIPGILGGAQRHHARHLRADRAGREARCARRPVRPQGQPRRGFGRARDASCGRWSRARSSRTTRSPPITTAWRRTS